MQHRSGKVTRGLAVVAVSALAITGAPLVGTASASPNHGQDARRATATTLTVVAEPRRAAYDFDELDDTAFTVTATDQHGAGSAGEPVQYRWLVDPSGEGADLGTGWLDAAATGAEGITSVPFVSRPAAYGATGLPAGSYTLEVRRPDGDGAGALEAAPLSFPVAESEIAFDEGAGAKAPLHGSFTVTGELALVGGGGSVLADRTVTITETGAGDVAFAPTAEQPPGTTVDGGVASAVTDADGRFSVVLTDPAPPGGVPTPETAVVTAVAPALVGDVARNDGVPANDEADSEASLRVDFAPAADVASIQVDVDALFAGPAAPGRPVDLDIRVLGEGSVPLPDYPVTVAVDRGFLGDDAETVADLRLAGGQRAPGDLFGYYRDRGQQVQLTTDDAGSEVGAIVAIERDPGFDDDGLLTATVTVQAGDVTETRQVEFDAANSLNIRKVRLKRASGGIRPLVGEEVSFHLFASDQFGNLVGDLEATVADDADQAEVATDGAAGSTATDWAGSPATIVATAEAAVVQTLTATLADLPVVTVGPDGAPVTGTRSLADDGVPITWTAPAAEVVARLQGHDNGARADRLRVTTKPAAAGAEVRLFRVEGGARVLVAGARLNGMGVRAFRVRDSNGRGQTTYVAQVASTDTTRPDGTRPRRVR